MRNFKQLRIWQKGFDISVKSFKLTALFPPQQKFGIISRVTRAAVSIPSNIAQGSSRSSKKDYNRFLEISLGSTYELETQLLISQAAGLGNINLSTEILADIVEEQKMLSGFINKLNG